MLNLTPHVITIIGADGAPAASVPPSGALVRLVDTVAPAGEAAPGVPAVRVTRGAPIVSGSAEALAAANAALADPTSVVLVADLAGDAVAAWLRRPVFSPYTGPSSVVRDDQGRIVGVRQLRRHDP